MTPTQPSNKPHDADKLVSMMKDLELILRIVSTMQERSYVANKSKREAQEAELAKQRGKIALDIIRHWLEHGDVRQYQMANSRLTMMLHIHPARVEKTVEELANVYERNFTRLLSGAIKREQAAQQQRLDQFTQRFQKLPFEGVASCGLSR